MNHTANATQRHRRHPALALLLSLAATGLGQIYCGHLTKGLILYFVSFAFAPVIVATAQSAASTAMVAVVVVALLLVLGVFVYAAVDAFRLARKTTDFQPKEYNRWPVYLLLILVSITYPTNLAANIRTNLWQAFKIPSTSMAPGILPGDRIFLNKAAYHFTSPQRGDVVIFTYPDDRRLFYLKRIVALPGDTIEIRDNLVLVNDHPLRQQAMERTPGVNFEVEDHARAVEEQNGDAHYPVLIDTGHSENLPRTTVPHGHCFVMGDNRGQSKDSRHFGPVPLADVKGRLNYIYWPAVSWQRFGRYPG